MIDAETPDDIAAEIFWIICTEMVIREPILSAVVFVQSTTRCSNPQHAITAFADGCNNIVAQAGFHPGIILIVNKAS